MTLDTVVDTHIATHMVTRCLPAAHDQVTGCACSVCTCSSSPGDADPRKLLSKDAWGPRVLWGLGVSVRTVAAATAPAGSSTVQGHTLRATRPWERTQLPGQCSSRLAFWTECGGRLSACAGANLKYSPLSPPPHTHTPSEGVLRGVRVGAIVFDPGMTRRLPWNTAGAANGGAAGEGRARPGMAWGRAQDAV